jgi:hypothetical protein
MIAQRLTLVRFVIVTAGCTRGGPVPRHVITLIAVTAAFFGLLWFGVVVLNQNEGEVILASFATLFLIGLGIFFSTASTRGEKQE